MPGDRQTLIAKAGTRGADALILDLEDAVAPEHKDDARSNIAEALAAGIEGADEIWVRVNAPSANGGADIAADFDVAVVPGVAGIVIAKVDSVDEAISAIDVVKKIEAARHMSGDLEIAVMVESASGLLACEAIASLDRVTRIQAGEADLAASLGIEVALDELELLPIRHRIVLAAAAAGIDPPIAPVSTEITNLDRLRTSSERLRRLGFVGRAVIHPAQISIVHEVFAPDAGRVASAALVIEQFERALSKGAGVIVDDQGRMIDEAVIRSARRILDRVRDR